MLFLNPTYLLALLALTIPLAIHLWSKKEGETIKIGSIKLLSEADSKQSSSIKLNELWLLLLRMLLITLLVFIMAEPQLKREIQKTQITYIVEPSLLNNKEMATIIDSLRSIGSVRSLQTGFPEYQDDHLDINNTNVPTYWQLAKEMETLATDSIVVFTNAFVSGIKGMRPIISKKIEWIVIDSAEPIKMALEAVQKDDQLQLSYASSNHQSLTFEKENIPINSNTLVFNQSKDSVKLASNQKEQWLPIKTQEIITVLLFYEANFINEANYIEASYKAISKHLNHPIEITKTQDTSSLNLSAYKNIIWLSEKPMQKTVSKILLYKADSFAQALVINGDSKDLFYLTKRLNTENIIEEHLPEHLLSMLDLHRELEHKINQYDKRVIDKEELLTVNSVVKTNTKALNVLSISKWLWILLAVLLIAERIIANYRKQ